MSPDQRSDTVASDSLLTSEGKSYEDLREQDALRELRSVRAELEGLGARVAKLRVREEALQTRLIEVGDRTVRQERARDIASRVQNGPPKVTYKCRYCFRSTRRLFGALPVCDECRSELEFIASIDAIVEEDL